MIHQIFLPWLALFLVSAAASSTFEADANTLRPDICAQIQRKLSNTTSVFFPGSPDYAQDILHFSPASTQLSECSVRPRTVADVSALIKILGHSRKPFAVKGGGHTMNPGFSSTPGVHIAMSWFNEVTYDAQKKTATVGTGLIWDQVYAALEPHGVGVVGGRVPGVGVAGLTLGGGYGWTTNTYGLAVDNVVSFQLVTPNGSVVTVDAKSDPELFFGLKGGGNNFGIVTSITLRTHRQGPVWGGIAVFAEAIPGSVKALFNASAAFQAQNKDPKAVLLATTFTLQGQILGNLQLFYDGPNPPNGTFDALLRVPSVQIAAEFKTKTFLQHILSVDLSQSFGQRTRYGGIPTPNYTPTLVATIYNEVAKRAQLRVPGAVSIGFFATLESFTDSAWTHGLNAAYPSDSSRREHLKPTVTNVAYIADPSLFGNQLTQLDAAVLVEIRKLDQAITDAGEDEGQRIRGAVQYPNYSLTGTPLEKLYGQRNVIRLRVLKQRIDPWNVMGLAGGFKIPTF